MLKSYILPVTSIREETSDTISISFSQPLIDRIPYYAGQYITLKVSIDGKTHYRSYSMSSTPRLDDVLTITVKRVKAGLVSNYLHDHIKAGDLVEFLRPAGKFFVETATKRERHLVCFAGGSGITPIMSILRGILYHEPRSKVTLFYASRSAQGIIFQAALGQLADTFSQRFTLHHILSEQAADMLTNRKAGRLQTHEVEGWVKSMMQKTPELTVYLCGPEGFMQVVNTGLRNLGMPEDRVHLERFVANDEMTQRQSAYDGPAHWVAVNHAGKLHQIKVAPGMTVIQAALNQGIELPYSCKRGICSTCMGQLHTGEMEMIDPACLLDFEREQGKVLLCQAFPTSDGVEVEV